MKKRTFSAVAVVVLLLGSAIAGNISISGDYVEARTADVYTGACVANGEMNLAGKEAILAWRVRDGKWQGVDVSGLSVVAVVRANATLGDVFNSPLPARSVIVVDRGANPEQRDALVNMAKDLGGDLLSDVLWVQARDIQFETGGHGEATVKAGELAALETRCMSQADHLCGNEDVYYPPLTKVAGAMPAYTVENSFKGDGLDTTWSLGHKRNAFIGTFAR